MGRSKLIAATEEHVRELFREDATGHDWNHVDRVRRLALTIAKAEGADLELVELAALLHDVGDWKFHDDPNAAPKLIREWLASQGADPDLIREVIEIAEGVSYKGAGVETKPRTLEGQVVQDADRLDGIGAIGVARAFSYGASKGRPMHDPAQPPQTHNSFAAYKANQGPTINHFYEKLLLLKDRMHTPTARQLAEPRHAFLETFLKQFLAEW